ncbi:hypothetical protein [uncultured Ilyobacter sp.]|uniref:hypothetical protein n=1 Tax=uncultured Ilyobacter sp. TaxID=544433 RepID=UPI002AA93886|nr:hypothetical protein [uncultured Ilyobacter sp.]
MKKIIYLIIFTLSYFPALSAVPIIIKDANGKITYEKDQEGNIIKKDFFNFKYDDFGRVIFLDDGDITMTYAYKDNLDNTTDVNVVMREKSKRRDFSYKIIKKETPTKRTEEIHGLTVAFRSGHSQNKLLFSKETLLDEKGKPFEILEKEYVRRIGKNPTLYFMKYPIIRRFTRKVPTRKGGWSEISYTTNEEGHYSVRKGKNFVNYTTEAVYRPQSFINGNGIGVTVKIYNPKGRLDFVENNGRRFLYNYFYSGKNEERHIEKLEIVNSGTVLETLYYSYPNGYIDPKNSTPETDLVDKEDTLEEDESVSVLGNFKSIDLSENTPLTEIVEDFDSPIYKKEVRFRRYEQE